jgi:N-acetylglucosamine kinase-like BadF-type ATPase
MRTSYKGVRTLLAPIVMGVDAGNTKTLAVIADGTGQVLGYGRSTSANIYVNFDGAVAALKEAARAALEMAGVNHLDHLAVSAAGADWPEDFVALRGAVHAASLVTDSSKLSVVNDAVGALWSGSATGEGVAVAVGTSAGTAARSGETVWHSGYWQEPEGAVQLGQQTLRAVYRAELELYPRTSLTNVVLKHFQVDRVEALLHAFTARGSSLGTNDIGRLARLLLDEAQKGDEVACQLVLQHGVALGDYAVVAARKVDFISQPFPLILTGGVMRHSSSLLKDTLVARVHEHFPGAKLQDPDFEPVGGAVCVALNALGCHHIGSRTRLRETLPEGSFYTT